MTIKSSPRDQSGERRLAQLRAADPDDMDHVEDALWVAKQLDEDVKKEDSPALSAWNLLVWARDNKTHFFKETLPKAWAAKQKRKQGPDEDDDVIQSEDRALADMQVKLKPYMDSLRVVCPNCGADLDDAIASKHAEARKVAEERYAAERAAGKVG